MNAQNHSIVRHGQGKFAVYLASCVLAALLQGVCYVETAAAERTCIDEKRVEYDRIFLRQIAVTEGIDALYGYAGLFNSDRNDARLQDIVSRRKQELLASIIELSEADNRLYYKLLNEINTFLVVKDSVRVLKNEEALILRDLRRCMGGNKP
ncbi:hypothetical protein AGMMS49965_01380 [Bacteroidia bacterium]|nr:hypothetical protein AGMMS49965_01380 [Bacteroidia bacterium]